MVYLPASTCREMDWKCMDGSTKALAEKITLPDLLVCCRADTATLMERIAIRDRSYERNMDSNYIDELNKAYDSFFSGPMNGTPVLVIDTNPLDFVRQVEHLKVIENRIFTRICAWCLSSLNFHSEIKG